jgi:hypothetical protein
MLSSLLRLVSFLAIAVLVVSFVAFANDEAGHGSKQTVARIDAADSNDSATAANDVNSPDPSASTERIRQHRHGTVREKIDDVDDALLSPFAGIATARSIWVQRIVTGVLGLVVYGFGLGLVARWARSRGI